MEESTLAKLRRQHEDASAEYDRVRIELGKARKLLAADQVEATIADRPIDKKLEARVKGLEGAEAERHTQLGLLVQAINVQVTREEEQASQRRYDALQKFKASQKGVIERIRELAMDLRVEVERYAIGELESGLLIDGNMRADILWPVANPQQPGADLNLRSQQLLMISAAYGWVQDDAMHSISRVKKNGSVNRAAR